MSRSFIQLAGYLGTLIAFFALLLPSVPVSAVVLSKASSITGQGSVVGTLSVTVTKSFLIDHPLDPKNKLLYHYNLESPDIMNIYDGIVVLDSNGEARIDLPDYFFALNKDFRYLATPLGAPMPDLHLSSEVHRKFLWILGPPSIVLAGGVPGGRVSWQVTGIRHDPYVLAHPIITEVEKGPDALADKGEYLLPEYYEKK
ncbi:hypothetical protein HY971_02165 [Candidatus Kaiserbacteria bacterium]|nr:hypothetical protein [Candidatus Kaiserbacteria bacterium]